MRGRGYITTSWDDGHPNDERLADLLESYAIPATFYIPRTNPLNSLPVISEDSIRRLSGRGFDVGAHTLDHVVLTSQPDDRARYQITTSKDWLEQVTGQPCDMFSPPCGRFSPKHRTIIRDAGFTGFRSVEMWSTAPPRSEQGLRELATSIQAYPQRKVRVIKNLAKRKAVRNLQTFARFGWSGDWTDHAITLIERCATRGGTFHLWGHSWEIITPHHWQQLEKVCRAIKAASERLTLLTNAELTARR